MLNNPISVERTVGGRTIKIETNRIAKQATGSVIVTCGESVVMCVVTFGGQARQDFFPLTCDYREKTYAAGRFPGGYFKREGRPTTKEILTSRLIDRPHRPLFPAGYRTEVSVNAVVMSFDGENDTDVLAMVGASAAFTISEGYPFMGPTGSVRVGRVNGELVLNPTIEERAVSDLDIVVAGLEDAIIMVEGEAKEVTEDVMLDALDLAHSEIKELIKLQKELAEKLGRKLYEKPAETPLAYDADLLSEFEAEFYPRVQEANVATGGKFARKNAVRAVRSDLLEKYQAKIDADEVSEKALKEAFEELSHRAVRSHILDTGTRSDGRKTDEIREIEIEVGFLPRTHGSVLFTRGETQSIVTATLGTGRDTQRIDGLTEPYEKKFLLHYNFPSYCVGETWPNRGPKRREIGHGALAERSLQPVLPTDMEFPYSLRIVSEITESNGSSSMATVCGGTLALMDAGVPIRRPVAGIAMGLVKEGDKFAVLSDILGLEDHDGDMDFKVAGTQNGITGFQMDVKAKGGVSREIMSKALNQARDGRMHILRKMVTALASPRDTVSPWAPRLVQVKISNDKIGALIGPGGKNIRRIQEETLTKIDIDDAAGTATVAGGPGSDVDRAVREVRACTEEVEVGKIYSGEVVSVKDFGAFVAVLPNTEGLCHVSELADAFVKNVGDVVKIGDVIDVKVLQIDAQGRIRLSKKAVDIERKQQEAGAEAVAQ